MAGSGAETHRKMGRKVRKTGYAPRSRRLQKSYHPFFHSVQFLAQETMKEAVRRTTKKTVGSVIFMRKWRKIYV